MKVHWSRTEPNRFARSLFASLPTRYDRLAAVLSLGQDRRWRRAMVDRVIGGPARVLDVATGPAGVALQLAERTGAHVLGVDLSEPMLRRGQANVRTAGRQEQITLVLARAEELPFADSGFDALTFTYLLRYVDDPAATLGELARVVRPGGRVACVEFGRPRGAWLWPWRLYTRVGLPALGRLAGRQWYEVGRFLGPSIEGFYARHPLESQLAMWRRAGIANVVARSMSLGGGVVISGTRGAD